MLYEVGGARALGLVRLSVFAVWLVHIARDPFYLLAELPVETFSPVGLLRLAPAGVWTWLTDETVLRAVWWVLLTLLVLAVAGARPWRAVGIPAALLLTLQQSLLRSVGFINHAEIGILLCAWVLAVFPSADGFTLMRSPRDVRPDRDAGPYRLAILLMTLGLLFGYTAIGVHRIAHSSPEVFTGDSMLYYVGKTRFYPVDLLLPVRSWVLRRSALFGMINAGFVLVTAVEVLSPFCLVSRRFRHFWLVTILSFHVLTLLLMQIFFWENVILLILLLTGVAGLLPSVRSVPEPETGQSPA
jgi:hypothetical protein